jgi:hypothetical protein
MENTYEKVLKMAFGKTIVFKMKSKNQYSKYI